MPRVGLLIDACLSPPVSASNKKGGPGPGKVEIALRSRLRGLGRAIFNLHRVVLVDFKKRGDQGGEVLRINPRMPG